MSEQARSYLARAGVWVERRLREVLPPPDAPPPELHAAMHHLLFPGGKRLRPALAFAAAEAVGGKPEQALPIAAAVELVHTYSLIHDDLPCMDDDDERRGRPTVHRLFGEAVALLAGDALLAAAFEVLAAPAPDASPERQLETLRELAHAAGSSELVGGQADDLKSGGEGSDPGRIERIHRRKTAALITAAVVGGGRLGGGRPEQLDRLRRFGRSVGVAFQIADDLLDRDEDEGCSLVHALGAEAARARAEALLEEGLAAVAPLGAAAEPLRALGRFAVWRQG